MPIEAALEPGTAFDIRAHGAQGSLTAESARKLLEAAGYQALRGEVLGDPSGRGWTEMGQIDSYGHGNGWKVAFHAVDEIEDLAERIATLIAWGWPRVVVVTDHGWLMLPEPLPKAELPNSLAEPRKDRCARIKPGSSVDLPVMPWHWDASVRVAMAPGISSFQAGVQYAHGGLSLQECVTPVVTISTGVATAGVAIAKATWRGLRCNVTLLNATPEMTIDLRTRAANAASSIALTPKHPDPDGTAAIFADDEMSGAEALVVVLSGDGTVLAQQTTTIGG